MNYFNIAIAATLNILASSHDASAQDRVCPFGVEQCKVGFVWREAWDEDKVCVPGSSRTRAKTDKAAAASRKEPNSDQCKPGWVWRDGKPDDHVCVTGTTRNETARENREAASRREPRCSALNMCLREARDERTRCKASSFDPRSAALCETKFQTDTRNCRAQNPR